ncbi:MAG: sensor histidine kinase [Solirubrobacteraceae bacterium]
MRPLQRLPPERVRSLRRLAHPSLRLKLTLGFAVAMGVLLLALGVFIYDGFASSLDASLDAGLRARAADVHAFVEQANEGLGEVGARGALTAPPSDFVQVLAPGPRIVQQTAGIPRISMLDASQLETARRGAAWIVGVPAGGRLGRVRMLVTPVQAQGVSLLLVVGVSLRDREAALGRLLAVMLLGGPIALLLASLLGYGVATLSLRGVEAMRSRAALLSLGQPDGRLPVPKAADELRRLALTLNEMLRRNDAAFARERRFVADASHELRSPLAVLKAEIEVALAGDGTRQELRAALRSADSEVDRLVQLAYDLLTLAQAEDGRLTIECTDVCVGELLDHLRARFERRARAQGRTIEVGAAPQLRVAADPLRIEQALANLLENALRHGRGAIAIRAVAPADAPLLELHVADEGPGLPDDWVEAAFERFSRLDQGRTGDGSGLGLAIVRGIARAHGGDAHVANRPGRGADAWIALPRAPGSDAGTGSCAADAVPSIGLPRAAGFDARSLDAPSGTQ